MGGATRACHSGQVIQIDKACVTTSSKRNAKNRSAADNTLRICSYTLIYDSQRPVHGARAMIVCGRDQESKPQEVANHRNSNAVSQREVRQTKRTPLTYLVGSLFLWTNKHTICDLPRNSAFFKFGVDLRVRFAIKSLQISRRSAGPPPDGRLTAAAACHVASVL